MSKFKKDYDWWVLNENEVFWILEGKWYNVVPEENKSSIHDFSFSKWAKKYSGEIKSRRCNKNTYTDTMIWANKLSEAGLSGTMME